MELATQVPVEIAESVVAPRFTTRSLGIQVAVGTAFVFAGFSVFLLLRGQAIPWVNLAGTAAIAPFMFAFGVAPAAWMYRRRFPRRVAIRFGCVHVAGPYGTTSYPLNECQWFVGTTRHDELSGFLERAPALIIDSKVGRFACAVSTMIPSWVSALEQGNVRRIRPPSLCWVYACGGIGCVAGLALAGLLFLAGNQFGLPRDALSAGAAIEVFVMTLAGLDFGAAAWPGSRARERMSIHWVRLACLSLVTGIFVWFLGAGMVATAIVALGNAAILGVVWAHIARRSDVR